MVKKENSVISQIIIEDGNSIQDTCRHQRTQPIDDVIITNDRVEIHV